MEEFGFEPPELTASVLSMEFGTGGRIHQLWMAGASKGPENEEFQFVLNSMALDEEFVDDYFPGAILIGARTRPDDPWILSRNTTATILEETEDPSKIAFEYDFSLLPEIGAIGRFYEAPGLQPQVVWDLRIENRGRVSIEIGELGFPFALNNIYGGFANDAKGREELVQDRVTVHKSITGSSSYLYAQRLNGEPPGLFIVPGEDTSWEFFNSVPGSLKGDEGWAGIPIVYVYSSATVEREGWEPWFNGHTSIILEPGDVRHYKTIFVPTEHGRTDGALPSLASIGHPTLSIHPSAVVPAHIGATVQIAGATPTQISADVEAELEAESEENLGACLIKPAKPGPLKFTFEDTKGRLSSAHLLFTEPIEDLIRNRAKWICENQVQQDGPWKGAILMTDLDAGTLALDPEDYQQPLGLCSSLSDALYLAETQRSYPVTTQMQVLIDYVGWIRRFVQNPLTYGVHWELEAPGERFVNNGSFTCYALLACLYATLAQIDQDQAKEWTQLGLRTLFAATEFTNRDVTIDDQVLREAIEILSFEGFRHEIDMQPFAPLLQELNEQNLAVLQNDRTVFVTRSPSPSWWWYGSDQPIRTSFIPTRVASDQGEICLRRTTSEYAYRFLFAFNREMWNFPLTYARLAYAGLIGVWALVRPDGAASTGFCPDPSSEQFGISPLSGTVGISLYFYLRFTGSYVVPKADLALGCEVLSEEEIVTITPWDGLGKRIVVRTYEVDVESNFGRILEFKFKRDRTFASVRIQNPTEEEREVSFKISGLWGNRIKCEGAEQSDTDSGHTFTLKCKAGSDVLAELRVIE